MAGRKPNLLAYTTLALLAEEGRLSDLPPKEKMGLVLLVVALEAWHQDCKVNYLQDLKALAKKLTSQGHSDDCLDRTLENLGEPLLALLPPRHRKRPLRDALRSYLSGNTSGYQARDLWQAFLRRLDQGAQVPNLNCPSPPPAVPEFLLGLLPVPAMHRALVRVLHRAHKVPEKDLEVSLSALFAYGFVHSGTCQISWLSLSFRRKRALLFRRARAIDVQKQGKENLLLVQKQNGTAVAEFRKNQLLVYTDPEETQRLPSPKLKEILEAWYGVADPVANAFLQGGGKVFPTPQGYDWDLVEEYHEALLEALRDGVCPWFFAKSPPASGEAARKEEA